MEMLDIVDREDRPLNYQKEKSAAHKEKLFHRTAHIWIINRNREVIIQRRSSFKETSPDMWDISAAGHVRAGESVIEGALRELYEELGVHKETKDLVFIGKHRYEFTDNEVSEIKWIDHKELNDLKDIVPHLHEFAMLERYLEECKLIKDSDHLYHLPYCEDTDRPNLYLIKGQNYNVAIDAGNSYDHCQKFYLAVRLEGLQLPEVTLISHWHWDHTFGLCAVSGRTISTKLTHEILEKVSSYKWTIEAMEERLRTGEEIEFCHQNILREYPDLQKITVVNTKETVDEKMVLDLGDLQLILLPEPSTHCPDSLFVYIPQEKALIVEDSDWIDNYTADDYNDPERLEKMIAFFEGLDYEYHYLGHVEMIRKEEALKNLKTELQRIKMKDKE